VSIGTPLGFGGIPVTIPNLPVGVSFNQILSGRAVDEFFNMDQNVDTVSSEVGLDGEVVYSVTYDQSAAITLTLMKSSTLNIALSLAHNAMRNPLNQLLFTFPVRVFDPNSVGRLGDAQNCVITRNPPLSFGAAEGENSWALIAATHEISHGARVF